MASVIVREEFWRFGKTFGFIANGAPGGAWAGGCYPHPKEPRFIWLMMASPPNSFAANAQSKFRSRHISISSPAHPAARHLLPG